MCKFSHTIPGHSYTSQVSTPPWSKYSSHPLIFSIAGNYTALLGPGPSSFSESHMFSANTFWLSTLNSPRPLSLWHFILTSISQGQVSSPRLRLGWTSILQAHVSWSPWNNTPHFSLPLHPPHPGRESSLSDWTVDASFLSHICLLTEREHSGSFSSCPHAGAYSCPVLPKPEWASLILWWSTKKPIVVT